MGNETETPPKNETRPHAKYNYWSEFGRRSAAIDCPFCGATVRAFIWSLAGSGKKCPCGALHGGSGYTIAPQPKQKKK